MARRRPIVERPPDPDNEAAYRAWLKSGGAAAADPQPGGLVQLADVAAERIAWLWPGRIPSRKLTLIDGDPGVGKSTVAIDGAARVSTGRAWPDGAPCRRGNVLLLTAEDGLADTVRPRLDAAGGDPRRVLVLTHIGAEDGGRPVILPDDVPILTEIITRRRVRLVIIDVLMAFLSERVNSHRDQDVRRALMRLHIMAESTGAAVVALRHLNKAPGGSPMYRGGGSIGIIGQARAAHLAAWDPDDRSGERRLFAPIKVNVAAMPKALAYRLHDDAGHGCARLEWIGEDARAAADLLGPGEFPDEREDRDEATAWVKDFLAHAKGEAPFKEIAAHARRLGIADRTLKRARMKAGISYERRGWQEGTVWILDGYEPGADDAGEHQADGGDPAPESETPEDGQKVTELEAPNGPAMGPTGPHWGHWGHALGVGPNGPNGATEPAGTMTDPGKTD